MKKEEKIIILSLGGSLIIPTEGFNTRFIKGFKTMILDHIKKGYRFVIVCGGGATARNYQSAAQKVGDLVPEDIDWIGIHATRLNAHFMRTIFRKWAHPVVVKDPTEKENWTEKILIAAGWKPGFSTDFDAVKLAELYGAKKVINLSNIEYIYDKDPRTNADAVKKKEINWTDFRKIVGDTWVPGANVPFDPIASKLAQKLGLEVVVMRGTTLTQVQKAIAGEKFVGSVIRGE